MYLYFINRLASAVRPYLIELRSRQSISSSRQHLTEYILQCGMVSQDMLLHDVPRGRCLCMVNRPSIQCHRCHLSLHLWEGYNSTSQPASIPHLLLEAFMCTIQASNSSSCNHSGSINIQLINNLSNISTVLTSCYSLCKVTGNEIIRPNQLQW